MTIITAPAIDCRTADMLFPSDEEGNSLPVDQLAHRFAHEVACNHGMATVTPFTFNVLKAIDDDMVIEIIDGDEVEIIATATAGDLTIRFPMFF